LLDFAFQLFGRHIASPLPRVEPAEDGEDRHADEQRAEAEAGEEAESHGVAFSAVRESTEGPSLSAASHVADDPLE